MSAEVLLPSRSADPVERRAFTRVLLRGFVLAALYVVSGRLGLALAHEQDNATLFWPPTGVALASLVVFGVRYWPAVLVGSVTVNLMIGTAPLVALAMGTGNTSEAVVGALLLARLGFAPSFDTRRHVLALFGVALVASTISTALGVGALRLSDTIDDAMVGSVALTWWLGNVGGAIVVTPLVLLATCEPGAWRALVGRVDTWAILGATFATALAAFTGLGVGQWALLVAFLPFPFLVWAGLSLGPRGAMVGGAVVAVIAVVGTARGHGAFASFEPDARLLTLWAYAATMGAAASILAAAVAERERAEKERLAVEKAQHALDVRVRDTQRLEGLGLLASGVAHDFNNILAAIRVNAELLERRARDAEQAHLVGEIDHAVARASELCRQLLAYAGRTPTPLGPVSLPSVIDDVCRLASPSIPKDVRLEIDAPDDLPSVNGEASQLRQVLLNLVLNAVDAIGARKGTVRVEARAEDELVRLVVEDDGDGMDPDTLARIFDPFFTTKSKGRGLGLAAVAGIVKSHEGTLDVTSTPGRGTRFELVLRRAKEALAQTVEPAAAPAKKTSLRVLVADDEAPIRDVVRLTLELEGHAVECVADGELAVERVRTGEFDVVLLDLTMPGHGGVEALRAIREGRPTMGAVLMSGYDESQLAHDEVFLAKPFTIDALLDALARATA
ncbi:MAG: MASE1 domain-containing protein [Myxococcota bacterium]|jgi:signal transduction histidine kinase|nr:MASE1 domain-containing protein [Myxococcota bacterium]